jgi:hypothetical protein
MSEASHFPQLMRRTKAAEYVREVLNQPLEKTTLATMATRGAAPLSTSLEASSSTIAMTSTDGRLSAWGQRSPQPRSCAS